MRAPQVPDLKRAETKISVHIAFPLGTFFSYIGGGQPSRIVDMDPVFIQLGPMATSVSITLENSEVYGQRVQEMWSAAKPANGSAVSIKAEIDGTPYPIFTGIVNRATNWTREMITFECLSLASQYSRKIGTTLDKDTFANLPEANVGKIMPWVWGTITEYKPLLVDEDKITELSAAAISTDTIIYVKDASDFPATGSIRINDEVISYTVKTDTQFGDASFPVSRGQNDAYGDPTVASSHVVGNQVMEVGELKFCLAKHAIASANITNVRYIGRDNNLAAAAGTLYTVDDTGPTYITFDQAPVFEVPSTTHRLKLIDYEADTGSSTCDNPTYAAGGHADWTELNYATVDNGEILELERTSDVTEPGGDLIRAWLVVEYWKNFDDGASHHGEVYFNGGKLGDLPDASNTPVDIMEDQTSWLMSAGFEQSHTHTLSDGDHQHTVEGTGTHQFRPAMDEGDHTTSVWGSFPEAYDSDPSTYATMETSITKSQLKFLYLRGSEGLNIYRKIKKVLIQGKVRRTAGAGASAQCSWYYYIPDSTGAGHNFQYYIFQNKTTNDLPVAPADGETFTTGWVDVEAQAGGEVWAFDVHNSRFTFVDNTPAITVCDFDIYDMNVSFYIENATPVGFPEGLTYYWNYEPCGWSDSSGMENAFDLDWSSWADEVPLDTKFFWASISNPDSKVLAVIPAVVADHDEVTGEYWMRIYDVSAGTPYNTNFQGYIPGTNVAGSTVANSWLINLAAYDVKGSDFLDNGTFIRQNNITGATTKDIIEIGAWVLYDNAYTGLTGIEDVGDADAQDTNHSSLAWFDITAMDGWQYPVGKDIKVYLDGTAGDQVKVLRFMVLGEYAPMEKLMATEIVCDVVARDGTADNVLTDVLTEADLLGIPSANISVPTMARTLAGAVQEKVDGFGLLEQVLDEATCHGYWNWSGVFKVRFRDERANLGAEDYTITEVINISRGIQDLDSLINKIEAKYNYDFVENEMADNIIRTSSGSVTKYGKTSEQTMELQFIRSEATATTIADTVKSYLDECFEEFNVTVGMIGLNLEPGDLLRFVDADGVHAGKVEVKEARILNVLRDGIMVEFKGVRYDTE